MRDPPHSNSSTFLCKTGVWWWLSPRVTCEQVPDEAHLGTAELQSTRGRGPMEPPGHGGKEEGTESPVSFRKTQQDKGHGSAGLSWGGSACRGTLDEVAGGDGGQATPEQRWEGSKGVSRAAISARVRALGWELGVSWWGLEVSVAEMEPFSLRRVVGVRGQTA